MRQGRHDEREPNRPQRDSSPEESPRRRLFPNDPYRRFEEEQAYQRMQLEGREAPEYERIREEQASAEPFAEREGPPSFTSQFYGPFADSEDPRDRFRRTARPNSGQGWRSDRESAPPISQRNRANYSQPPQRSNDNTMHTGSYGYDEHAYQYSQLDEDASSPDSRTTYSQEFLGPYGGLGPKGYKRPDDRIREEVCEMLTRDSTVDAREIEVDVKEGEVTLTGTVGDRRMKYRAEDLAERCFGVRDIHNRLRVQKETPAEPLI